MSLARREILKATFIGLIVASVLFAVFTLTITIMQNQFTVDTEEFEAVVEWGEEIDYEGVVIIDNRTLGIVKTPLTKDMIVSIEDTERAGKKKITFEHKDQEFVIYVNVQFRVDFMSYGELIDSQLVFKSEELTPPTPVEKFGQKFVGWDVDLGGELTQSIQVNAVYETIEVPELETVTATYGDTLAGIKLPESSFGKWEFVDSPETAVGEVGSYDMRVKFTYYHNPEWIKYDSVKINVEKKRLEFKDIVDTFIYDGAEHFPTYKLDENVNVFVVGSPNTESGEYEYSFEILDANYEGSYSGKYTIAKPDVTVTVSSATIYYGENVPEFTYAVEGFENVELLGIRLEIPTFVSSVGVYEIGITYTNENVNYIIHNGALTVLKADQEVSDPELGAVTYGDKLGDITFEGRYLGTWVWENPDIIVDDINGITAWAIYTPDNENYNQVRKLITISKVNKRVLEIHVDQSTFTYAPGVEYSIIYTIGDGSYQHLTVLGNEPEINADRYTKTLEIDDPCYEGKIVVDLVINKAMPEIDFSKVLEISWNENLYLYDVELPAGYKWERSSTKIEGVGTYVYSATYTHEDSNYYIVAGEFTVEVVKANVTLIGVKDSYETTYVKGKVFDVTGGISAMFTDGTLSFEYYLDGEKVDAMVSAGEYTVLIKVSEGTNYLAATVERTAIIRQATNTESVNTSQKATYGDSIDKLALPEGDEGYWVWANAGGTVGNAGVNVLIAKYVSTTGNYAEREVEVTVTVDRATAIIPIIADRYFINDIIKSGLTDTDIYEVVVSTDIGGTNVGTYSVTLKLKDFNNFKWENTDGTSDLYEITYKIVTASITDLTLTISKTTWKFEDDYAVITASKTESFGQILIVYSTSKNGTYTETVPTNAGTYYVKAIVRAEDDSATPDWSYAETLPTSFTIEKDIANITGIKSEDDYKYVYNFDVIDVTGGIDIDHTELDADDLVFEYWLSGQKVDLIKDPGTYTVKISAAETTNYNATSREFTVVVSKIANEDAIPDSVLHQNAVYGDDISTIELPEHTAGIGSWSVITTAETVGNAGTNTFTIKFTPSQANIKYYAEREITITVEVDRKTVLRPTLSITTGIYNGSAYIPTLTHRDDSTLYTYTDFSDILTVGALNVGTYTITFSLGENASNYKWEDGDSEIDLTLVIRADVDYTIGVTVDQWIYNDSNENDTKIHVTVPAGVEGSKTIEYFVKNEDGTYTSAVPKNAGTYYVKVTVAGDNSGNGNWSEECTDYIEFTIGKDTVDFGTIELDAIYNQTLSDIASKLPEVPEGALTWNAPDTVVGEAGYTYTFYATYTSTTGNYNSNSAVAISVTVEKAASVISGFVDKTFDFIGSDYRSEIENAVTVTGTGTLTFTVQLNGVSTDEIKNQGTYTVYVTYSGDNNYEAITDLEPITVTVNAVTVEPTVSIEDWVYSIGNVNAKAPELTGVPEFVTANYISYYYTGTTNAGAAYANEAVPTEAGSYTVTVTVEASELGNWAQAVAQCDFVIDRDTASLTLNTEHSTYYTGSVYDILSKVTVANGVGAPTFTIITFNGNETDLTEIIGAGQYVLTVSLAQSANYYAAIVENVTVDVQKAITSITGLAGFVKDYADTDYLGLVMNGVVISVAEGTVNPDPNGNKIVWTINGVEIDEDTKIINQGTYTVVATYEGDENYETVSDSCTVTVKALTTRVDTVSGIDGKTYDGNALEATVTLTNGYTDPSIKYYIKNGESYTWLGLDADGNPVLPVNAGTYRIGISATGDDINGNWTALTETYSDDFTIGVVVVPYPDMYNKPYTGQHIPSGYEDEWRYDVEEGTENIEIGIYDVVFTLNNFDGVINFVWEDGKTDVYYTSYKILSADDNVWTPTPSIVPVIGDKIVYREGMEIIAGTKFGGYDVTFYKYNSETGEYDEVGTSVYLRDEDGEIYLSVDETPTYAGIYRAVFSFNDVHHVGDSKTVNFTIERKEVLRPTLSIVEGIYNGSVYLPTLTHRDDDTLYTYTDLSDILGVGAENVGTYSITFSLGDNADNYKWENGDSEITLTLVITPNEDYEIGVTVDEWIYNDTNDGDSKIHISVPAGVIGAQTIEYFVKNEDSTYTETVPKNAGTYFVKVTVAGDNSGNGNWTEETTDYIEFTIEKDDLDFGTIELDAIYGQTLSDLTAKLPTTIGGVSIEGSLVWNAADSTEVGDAGSNEFTVKYVPDTNGNYNAIDEITVTVNVERLGINIPTLIKNSFEFDGTEVTLLELFGTETFIGYTVTVDANVNARAEQYTVTLTLDGNHKWIIGDNEYTTDDQERKFTITKALFADKITVEVSKDEWIYGTTAGTVTKDGVPEFIDSTVSYRYVGVDVDYDSNVMPENIGTYNVYVVVEASASGNWDEQTSDAFDQFTITKKQLTVNYVNTDLVYGGADAQLDYNHYGIVYGNLSLSGIVAGDDVSLVRDDSIVISDVGDYIVSLVLTGDDADNYSLNISYIEEYVAKKTTEVDINSEKFTADGQQVNGKIFNNVAIAVEVIGRNHAFGTETVTYYYMNESGEYTKMAEGAVPTNAGSYKAVVTISGSKNWDKAEDSVEFVIAKATLTPVITITGWVYDPNNANVNAPIITEGTIPAFVNTTPKFTYSGRTNAGVTYTGGEDGTVAPTEAGSYTVTLTIPASELGNWDETTVSVNFNVTRAPLGITYTTSELTYNGSNRYDEIKAMFGASNGSTDFIIKDEDGNVVTDFTEAGTYKVIVSINLTANYQAASTGETPIEITINAIETDVEVSVGNSYLVDGVEMPGKVYNGLSVKIETSNNALTDADVTYYKWNDEINDYEELPTGTVPTDAGSYKVVVSVSETNNWSEDSDEAFFTIAPAPSKIEIDQTIIDNNNEINVDFNTAEQKLETLIGAEGDYEDAEVEYEIIAYTKHGVATFALTDGVELPDVIKDAGIYTIEVTLKSHHNYVDAEPVIITVIVDKIEYQFGSINIGATYGQTLADIASKLPTFDHGTLTWNLSSTAVGNAGSTYTFTATYTNTDGNYLDNDSVEVNVTVSKADTVISGFNSSYTLHYDGSDLLADIISGAAVKRDGVTVTDAEISWTLTEIVAIGTYTVTATYDGDSNHNGYTASSVIVVDPASVEIKDFALDSNSIIYTQTVTPGATILINGEAESDITGPVLIFLYSTDGSEWKTLDEFKNSNGYLNHGTYFVKAVVNAEPDDVWEAVESSPLSFTVSKIALTGDDFHIVYTGEQDAAGNYYQNSVVINYEESYVECIIGNETVRINGSFNTEKTGVSFKGADSTFNFTFNLSDEYEGNIVANDVPVNIPLKIVALVGNNYPTSYTYPADSTNPNAYGSIEDAVTKSAANSTIWVVPDVSGNVIIKDDLKITGNKTLVLPYGAASDASGRNQSGQSTDTTAKKLPGNVDDTKLTNKVLLADGKKLTVESGSTLEISGIISGGGGGQEFAGHTSGNHARLVMGAGSEIICKGTMKVYGYIHEADDNNRSSITVENGGTLYQPLVLRDFKGGSLMYGLYQGMDDYGYSPFNMLMFINVHPTVTYKYGGECRVWANLVTTDPLGSIIGSNSSKHNHTEGLLIGTKDSKNSKGSSETPFIELTDSTYSSLVNKYDKNTDIMYTDVYGGAKTHSLVLKLTVVYTSISVSSEKFVYGWSWMNNISLHQADKQTATAQFNMDQDYKLLPGSSLTVGEGTSLSVGTLTVYEGYDPETQLGFYDKIATCPYPVVYPKTSSYWTGDSIDAGGTLIPDAKLIVNGTLTATNLGGKVYTQSDNAVIKVTGSTTVTTYEASVYSGSNTDTQIDAHQIITNKLELWYEYEEGGETKYKKSGFAVSNVEYTSDSDSKMWIPDGNLIDFTIQPGTSVTAGGETYTATTETGPITITVIEGSIVTFHLTKNYIVVTDGSNKKTIPYNEVATGDYDFEWAAKAGETPAIYYVPSFSIQKIEGIDSDKCTVTYSGLSTSNVPGNSTAKVEITITKAYSKTNWKISAIITVSGTGFTDSNITAISGDKSGYTCTRTASDSATATMKITLTEANDGAVITSIKGETKDVEQESSGGTCVTPDTMITLADGTQVRVDSLTGDELLLVWNLETGKLDFAPIMFVDSDALAEFEVIYLHFSDGTVVKVITEHGFWDYDLNKYVYLDENAADYIGHYFAKQDGDDLAKVQLVDVEIRTELTTAWSPVTVGHLCYFVNGMLSMPGGVGGLFNIFDVDSETMTYDYEAIARDIETYGLFTYEELNAIFPLSESMFEAAGGAYLKISIGKGNLTMEELGAMINRYSIYV